MKKHWSDVLVKIGACAEATEWAREQPSAKAAWESCKQADWVLWIAGRLCSTEKRRKKVAHAACQCARTALKYTTDQRVLECIETVERWCDGEATIEQVRAARRAAAAYAAAAADAADAAAAYAAYAAAAAAAAADAAYAAYAAAAARARALADMAIIVRKHLTMPRPMRKQVKR